MWILTGSCASRCGPLTTSTCSTSAAIRLTPSRMTLQYCCARPSSGNIPGHQLGRALDSSERILDLVREARRRQPQAQITGFCSLSGAFFMGQVVQQYYDAAGPALGVQQRRHLDAHRQLPRPGRQDGLHVAQVLPALEARPDHPPEPIVLPHQIGHRRSVDLRDPEHRLGRRVDDLGLHRGRQDDDAVGQAVDDVVPEIQSFIPGQAQIFSPVRRLIKGLEQPT